MAATATNGRFRHLALFYHGHGEYLAALCAFIQASRARGEAVFVAVPERKAQLMRQELGADSAQLMLVDMAELGRNPARIIPAVLAYAGKHRGQRVCCIGEPIWPGRTEAELQEAARHEALVNLAFRGSPVTFLCAYDSTGLPGSVIADAASTHPAVVKDRQEIASARYLGPAVLPRRCNRALPRPPAHAPALGYRDDLRPVRRFVASRAKCAGLTPLRIPDLVIAASELAANTLCHTGGGRTVHVWRTSLWVVNQVCDLVQARTGQAGTTTRLHMRLREP